MIWTQYADAGPYVKSRRLDDLGTELGQGSRAYPGHRSNTSGDIEKGMIDGDLVKLSREMRRMAGNQNRESEKTIKSWASRGWLAVEHFSYGCFRLVVLTTDEVHALLWPFDMLVLLRLFYFILHQCVCVDLMLSYRMRNVNQGITYSCAQSSHASYIYWLGWLNSNPLFTFKFHQLVCGWVVPTFKLSMKTMADRGFDWILAGFALKCWCSVAVTFLSSNWWEPLQNQRANWWQADTNYPDIYFNICPVTELNIVLWIAVSLSYQSPVHNLRVGFVVFAKCRRELSRKMLTILTLRGLSEIRPSQNLRSTLTKIPSWTSA